MGPQVKTQLNDNEVMTAARCLAVLHKTQTTEALPSIHDALTAAAIDLQTVDVSAFYTGPVADLLTHYTRQPLDLTGMVFASQSYTGRAIKNLDRLIISVPMKNDGSCALWGLLDGHHKSTAVSFAHNKLLSCIAEAQRKGLAPRYAVAQGMQTCDQLYLQAPTILTDDRFGSGTGALVVLLHMGTLFTW